MLKQLTISNLAVIDHLQIEFGEGLNVLTGETGSGKSIIIDAVELLLGGRTSQEAIRTGVERAAVEGVFSAAGNPTLRQLFEEAGIEFNEGELIVRRDIASTGRGRIFVNNQASTVAFLRTIQPHLLDLHGQGDQQSLMLPSTHLLLVDLFAGLSTQRAVIADVYHKFIDALAELESRSKSESSRILELESLRYQLEEIETARVRPSEDLELESEHAVLANAERILRICGESYSQIYDDERAILSTIGIIGRHLEELTTLDAQFQPQVDQLQTIKFSLEEIAFFLRSYIVNIQVSPEHLAKIEDRLANLERLKRKYGGSIVSIEQRASVLSRHIEELEDGENSLAGLLSTMRGLLEEYGSLASALSEGRRSRARDFERQLGSEFSAVALEKAQFQIRFSRPESSAIEQRLLPWASALATDGVVARFGRETAEFLFSANPGEDLKPLNGVASGGELSRLMLVIKNVVSPTTFPRTLIFDEIDAGIGGRVADAIGMRLKHLAKTNQVFCVTHQAQIARYADAHFLISKQIDEGRTRTGASLLDEDGRVDELARMLAGAEVTQLARRHARELIRTKVRDEGSK